LWKACLFEAPGQLVRPAMLKFPFTQGQQKRFVAVSTDFALTGAHSAKSLCMVDSLKAFNASFGGVSSAGFMGRPCNKLL